MAKIKRPDVALRLQNNKLINHSVIKTSWNSFAKRETKNTLQIDRLLMNLNKITFEGYKLANLHVIRLLQSQQHHKIVVDKNFYYNCLSGVSVASRNNIKIKDVELRNSVNVYNTYKPTNYRPATNHT